MNAIGTHLRDPINSGLTRWRMVVSSMDAAAELGRNPASKHQIQPEYGDKEADAGQNCRTRLASLRRERGQGNIHFPCSADHVQGWQPYPVDPYSCYRLCHDHSYILVVPIGLELCVSC